MVDQSEIPNPCPLTNQSRGLTGSPGAGPAPAVDVIDSRDKNWETKRNVKGVFSSQNNSCDVVQSEL